MSEPRSTQGQWKANSELNKHLSVSAGAGAGKTWVLTQRYAAMLAGRPMVLPPLELEAEAAERAVHPHEVLRGQLLLHIFQGRAYQVFLISGYYKGIVVVGLHPQNIAVHHLYDPVLYLHKDVVGSYFLLFAICGMCCLFGFLCFLVVPVQGDFDGGAQAFMIEGLYQKTVYVY